MTLLSGYDAIIALPMKIDSRQIMMKKTALLIDGAFLRAVATKHHGIDSADYTADFIEQFALKCVDEKEEELFRIFYYDCLPNKKPQRYPISGREYVSPTEASWQDDLPRKKHFAVMCYC